MAESHSQHSGYLRLPTIHRDTVVFVCEDDLWTVAATGGRAWRLTTGVAESSSPRLSPDGTMLAFTGSEEGAPEVYLMPASGGEARRLTHQQAATCAVVGWHPDGGVVYSSGAGTPHGVAWLYEVDTAGGLPRRLPLGPARSISFGAGGAAVLGRRVSREPAAWKRYRGGTAGQLWIDPDGAGDYHRLVELEGNLVNPCWVGDRIYFLSDHEGIGNVYSTTVAGTQLRRHTDHGDYYARNLSSDGERLIYHAGADLYLLEPGEPAPRLLELTLGSSRTQRNRRFTPARTYLDTARLSPDGSGLAITTRGKAFHFGNWEGPVEQIGESDGVRYRFASWLPKRDRIVAAAGDDGEQERLAVLSVDPTVEPVLVGDEQLGLVTSLEVSPTADQVAVTTTRNGLVLLDLTGEQPRLRHLDRSPHREIGDLTWSTDGAWLAYTYPATAQTSAIKVCAVATGETTLVTEPVLLDHSPAFDPEGKYLYFLGRRELDPVFDSVQFDLGFPQSDRPYAVTLRGDTPAPFVPQPAPLEPPSGDDGKAESAATTTADPAAPVSGDGATGDGATRDEPGASADGAAPSGRDGGAGGGGGAIRIDLDGIARRVVPFPVPLGRYGRIAAVKGKVLWSRYPVQGTLGDDDDHRGWIEAFDHATLKVERQVEEVSDFRLGADGTTLLYWSGTRLRVLRAGSKPPEDGDGDTPGRSSGWIDLDRVKVSISPAAEWRQMFHEAWRLQREHFWSEDMSGVDWERVRQRYLPLLERVTTRSEFSDLVWELHGELGTSHAYERGGEYRSGPRYHQGFLGVEWERDADSGHYRIAAILDGDLWRPEATSPLNRPGVDARVGDVVLAINGQPVGGTAAGAATPGERLVNLAEQEVRLTLRRGTAAPHRVTVRTLDDESAARYRDWVAHNRATVHERSDGRVGYLHVPDMMWRGFAEFHRSFLTEYDRDALIVDVRYNRGGAVSGLLLQKLARRRIAYDYARWRSPQPYPEESPSGPLVAVTNEWAGSDGDIFSHAFKMLGLGPLIGTRTWGGVIGISPRRALADGTVTTQPEYSFAFDDVLWQVENYGTDPDIEVDITPQDYAAGRDPQLDRAIAEALHRLVERPPHRPSPPAARPRLALPELPARTTGATTG